MVQLRHDVVGLDASILMHPRVWEASGHLANFSDPLVECTRCNHRFRADHLEERIASGELASFVCPDCGGSFTEAKNFNLMFKTFAGPVEDDNAVVWLRPETAQGMFVDFATIQRTSRSKIPFGIAQMGKSFRNEITPGNFVFRTREFEQMEMEFFVEPGTDEDWHQFWIDERRRWYEDLGMRSENIRVREHTADELSHYAKRTVDLEFYFPDPSMGWSELEGIANRTDFDLKAHEAASGQDLSYFDPATNERYHPYVIEPAAGATRATLAFLYDAYRVEKAPDAEGEMQERVVLKLDPRLAPYQVAVLPLSKKPELAEVSRQVFDLLKVDRMVEYDETQSIGRRYRRQDEIGTPACVTVDFDTIEDRAVTVRDRDTMAQERVSIDRLPGYLDERLPRR
jgi:glycyl-tRNA synthetase